MTEVLANLKEREIQTQLTPVEMLAIKTINETLTKNNNDTTIFKEVA
jgi:hypothetical protein